MTRAKAPVRAVATLVLSGAGRNVDIKVYKKCQKVSGIGLTNHMYHAEDYERVYRQDVCSGCEKVLEPAEIMRLAGLDDALVSVSKEEVAEYWAAGNEAKIIACPDQTKFANALINDSIYILEPYVVGPVDAFDEQDLQALLAGLKQLKRVALIDLPLNAQIRRAVLLPNGTLYTLYYENEIREQRQAIRKNVKVKAETIAFYVAKLGRRRNQIGKQNPPIDLEKIWDDLAEGA